MNDNAAERYLLGELTGPDADAFEDHMFECHLCAADVRDGSLMMKAVHKAVKEPPYPEPKEPPVNVVRIPPRPKPSWLPLAVAALLVIGIGFPALQKYLHRTPPAPRDFHLYLGDARRGGAADEKVIPAGYDRALLDVDVASSTPYPRYALTVRDARGRQIGAKTVTAAETEDPVRLTLLLRDLPAGSYGVVIEGVREDGKRSKVTTRSFEVRSHGP